MTSGAHCGDAGSECVHQDTCDGLGLCTDQGFPPPDTICGDGPTACSDQDTCDGTGGCAPNHVASGAACGDEGSPCVHPDDCDGVGGCVDRGFVSVGTLCGDGATVCSDPDTCDASGVCLTNDVEPHPAGYDPVCAVTPCPDHASGGPDCSCDPGYSGALSWDASTHSWDGACSEINECAGGPCGTGGTCTDQVNAYSCSCAGGYDGGGVNTPCSCTPVNGGWSGWSGWSGCSASCGGGSRSRSRTCNNPSPNVCGAGCSGPSSESQSCNTQVCMPPVTCSTWDGAPLKNSYDGGGNVGSPSDQMPRCCDPVGTCPGVSWGFQEWGRFAIRKSSLTAACSAYCGGSGSVTCTSQSTMGMSSMVVRIWNAYDFNACARPDVNTSPRARCDTMTQGNDGFAYCNVTGPQHSYTTCQDDGEGGSDCDNQTLPEGSVTCSCQ